MTDQATERARHNMIEQQLRPWEIFDQRVLDAMTRIPRERFVPDAYRALAFADTEIPIGHGQRMMAPKIEARMLQAVALRPDDRVLEIGTGSGFVTACLATLCAAVVSYEIEPELGSAAAARLEPLKLRGLELRVGNGLAPEGDARYDVIAVTGSLPTGAEIASLRELLTIGGRLFAVVGEGSAMNALLVTRVADRSFREDRLFETVLPPLAEAQRSDAFVF